MHGRWIKHTHTHTHTHATRIIGELHSYDLQACCILNVTFLSSVFASWAYAKEERNRPQRTLAHIYIYTRVIQLRPEPMPSGLCVELLFLDEALKTNERWRIPSQRGRPSYKQVVEKGSYYLIFGLYIETSDYLHLLSVLLLEAGHCWVRWREAVGHLKLCMFGTFGMMSFSKKAKKGFLFWPKSTTALHETSIATPQGSSFLHQSSMNQFDLCSLKMRATKARRHTI